MKDIEMMFNDTKSMFNNVLNIKDEHIQRHTVMRHLCFIIFNILYRKFSSIDEIKDTEIKEIAGMYKIGIKTNFINKLIKTDGEGNTTLVVHLHSFILSINDNIIYTIKFSYDSNGVMIIEDENLKIDTAIPESKLFINMLIRECIKSNIVTEDDIYYHYYIRDEGDDNDNS